MRSWRKSDRISALRNLRQRNFRGSFRITKDPQAPLRYAVRRSAAKPTDFLPLADLRHARGFSSLPAQLEVNAFLFPLLDQPLEVVHRQVELLRRVHQALIQLGV